MYFVGLLTFFTIILKNRSLKIRKVYAMQYFQSTLINILTRFWSKKFFEINV